MKIGILVTGDPPGDLGGRFGDYAGMMRALAGDRHEFTPYRVHDGELPAAPDAEQAYIVTGSPAAVYDDAPWIAALLEFLRAAKGKARLVGICFGHQAMAAAFGGRVEKAPGGWGVGLHSYRVQARRPWMDEGDAIAIPVSHQDQVIVLPPGAEVIAASPFTRFGALAYTDQPAISFQCHPEFTPAFAKALIETRRHRLPDPDAALTSLDAPDDRARVAAWIRRFLVADQS